MRNCTNPECKQSNPQPMSSFTLVNREKGYFCRKCKSCRSKSLAKIAKRWRDGHVEQFKTVQRANRLKREYGLTMAQYDAMHQEQDGKCQICKVRKDRLCVDHDHKTGRVRGLLCHHCNRAIGLLQDSPAYLRRAAEYLELYSSQASGGKIPDDIRDFKLRSLVLKGDPLDRTTIRDLV
jgi:hypothetical protein